MENENMNNGTQTQGTENKEANVVAPAQPQNVVPTQPTTTEPPKPNWIKRNWKKVAAGAVGLAGALGSAVVAYKKGKAAGIAAMPIQEPTASPLDPNVESY